MKVLYYDVFCGISGDMNLGALVDLGVDFEYLKTELKKLHIDEEFDVVARRDQKHGISGTKVDVILYNQHSHHHNEEQGSTNKHHHHHRNFATIRDMILRSELNEKVKELSIEIFRIIAEAEAKVHGKPIEEVHFHEVGATDSIVDIVGAAICYDALNVDKVMASSIQVGGGFVKCAHGRMPVPAPATSEILVDIPLKYNLVPFETTTPTGAAILKATVDTYIDQHQLTIKKTGYGLGNKDFEIPNILRVYLGELNEQQLDLEVETQFLMACNIDDMSGEYYSYLEERLFENGALDVYKTPIIMKKSRPAIQLNVLFKAKDRQILQRILFEESTTAGVREMPVTKYMMKRSFETITTQYGNVKVKHLYADGKIVKSKAEYEDCIKLSRQHSVTLRTIHESVQAILMKNKRTLKEK